MPVFFSGGSRGQPLSYTTVLQAKQLLSWGSSAVFAWCVAADIVLSEGQEGL